MICIYCGGQKADLEAKGDKYKFSKEHILPRSLIGTPKNNIFTIKNVCGDCNNRAGLLIDAPAVKGWFIQSKMAVLAADYAKIEDHPILPLIYMGQMRDLTYKGKVCDAWTGPTGDQIFHFHDPYPILNSYPAIIGVPPQFKKTADKGFVFIFIRSNNPAWHSTILKSFVEKFRGSMLFIANSREKPPTSSLFSEIPEEMYALHQQLSEIEEINVQFSYTPNSENKFLAKIALGIGSKFLGSAFDESADADKLRKYMWAKTNEERNKMSMNGTNFFNQEKEIDSNEYFGWEGGHLITLVNLPDCIALTITLYNSISASIKIEKSQYDYKKEIGDGICIIIVPSLNRIVGPMKYIHFLNHQLKMRIKNPELTAIELGLKQTKENRPAFEI
jgi:hypothetical protein